jgi:hypothetical protein
VLVHHREPVKGWNAAGATKVDDGGYNETRAQVAIKELSAARVRNFDGGGLGKAQTQR